MLPFRPGDSVGEGRIGESVDRVWGWGWYRSCRAVTLRVWYLDKEESASSGNWSSKFLHPIPDLSDQKLWKWGLRICVNNPCGWFWCTLKFENHRYRVLWVIVKTWFSLQVGWEHRTVLSKGELWSGLGFGYCDDSLKVRHQGGSRESLGVTVDHYSLKCGLWTSRICITWKLVWSTLQTYWGWGDGVQESGSTSPPWVSDDP